MSETVSNPPLSALVGRRSTRTGLALAISVGGHLLLAATLVGLALVEPAKLDLSQKPVAAHLVRLGTQRDPKLLPQKDAPAPAPAPKVVEIPGAAPSNAKPNPTSAGPKDSKADSRSRLFDAFAKTGGKPRELAGDPNGDPDGDSDTATEGERYFGLILSRARRNYSVTKTIGATELARLKAIVVIYIGSNGELLKDPELQASSGNAQFDQDVLLSLRKAAPFGPPPAKLARTLRTVGVAIEARP